MIVLSRVPAEFGAKTGQSGVGNAAAASDFPMDTPSKLSLLTWLVQLCTRSPATKMNDTSLVCPGETLQPAMYFTLPHGGLDTHHLSHEIATVEDVSRIPVDSPPGRYLCTIFKIIR